MASNNKGTPGTVGNPFSEENNWGWDISYEEAQSKYGVQKEVQNQMEYAKIWDEATERSRAKRERDEWHQMMHEYS